MSTSYEGALPAGVELARYRVESLLARGGMSEVYVAHDNILGRRVALKVLRDGERVQRFIREAEAASSLNHPAIVSVFDSGAVLHEGEAVQFMAMELVDGQTLARWARSTRDRRRKVELMAGVADGLARAHAHGIVHRDLKPDNIMVARGGYPKILDFGIAKLTDPSPSRDGDTAPDALLGTAAYMSPEQTERRAVDHRSDIFSFGAVLYEVLTGTPAFRRASTVDTLHAIAHEMPPLDGIEPSLARIVRRCLAKLPEDRYDSLHDVALDLRDAALGDDVADRKRRSLAPYLITALAVLSAIAAAMFFYVRTRPELMPGAQKTLSMQRVTNNGKTFAGAISPDGRFVAYAEMNGTQQTLWVKQLATDAAVRVRPADTVYYAGIEFAPSGDYIFYSVSHVREPNVYDLYRVPTIGGGEPELIAPDMEANFAISPDGARVAFRRFNVLQRDFVLLVASIDKRSERELLRKRHPEAIAGVSWMPGGRELAFAWFRNEPRPDLQFVALDVASGAQRTIERNEWEGIGEWQTFESFRWLPDGSGSVAAIAQQRQAPQVWWAPKSGRPRKITSDVSAYANLTVTADGSAILASRMEYSANLWLATIGERKARALTIGSGNRYGNGGVAWANGAVMFPNVGKNGPRLNVLRMDGTMTPQGDRNVWQPVVSPDGKRVAFLSDTTGVPEVWVADVTGANAAPVTRSGRAAHPQWFPDGTIAFVWSSRGQTLWRTSLDGETLVQLTRTATFMPAVSPDGKWILCRLRGKDGETPLWRTKLLSADGRVVRELPVPRFASGPILRWMPDGRIAYVDYKDGVANVWSADLEGNDARQLTHFDTGQIYAFAVAPDGKSIAISRGDPVSDLVLIRGFR